MGYYVIRLPMFQEDAGRSHTVGVFPTRAEAEDAITAQCESGYLRRSNFKILVEEPTQ
jgi:hypothetical protein